MSYSHAESATGVAVLTLTRCETCECSSGCACAETSQELIRHAKTLEKHGRALAQRRYYHAARHAFEEATALHEASEVGALALGLCCFVLGDLPAADAAWRKSAMLGKEAGGRPAALLAALHGPEVRSALNDYHAALDAARRGSAEQALVAIRRCRAVLPDFLPAARLEQVSQLLLRGVIDDACELTARFPDDPDLARLAGNSRDLPAHRSPRSSPRRQQSSWIALVSTGAILGALIVGVSVQLKLASPRHAAAVASAATNLERQAPLASANSNAPEAVASLMVRLALRSNAGSLAQLDALHRNGQLVVDDTTMRLLQSRLGAASQRAYRRSQRQEGRGQVAAAVTSLRDAVYAPPTAYFADDALYRLATLLSQNGLREEARIVANRLLSEHPRSPLANLHMRRIQSSSTPVIR